MSFLNWLKGLKIRLKLLAAFGSVLLLSVLLIIFSITSINKIIYYKSINEQVDGLKLHLETMDVAVKDFMYEGYKLNEFQEIGKNKSIDKFDTALNAANRILSQLENSAELKKFKTASASKNLKLTFDNIDSHFNLLVTLLKKRGFRDFGLEGTLRDAIHKVENSEFEYDKAEMLSLRRHEKDFFLRKDLKYQVEFNNDIEKFKSLLRAKEDADALKVIITNLENYRKQFNDVVEIEKQIGLKETEGIRGEIKNNFETTKPELERFRLSVKADNEKEILQTKIILTVIFGFQLLVGMLMAILYSNLITSPIKEIRSAMQALASGLFPKKLKVFTNEELGQTKSALNQFLDRIAFASQFAMHLGNGNLDAEYDEKFSNDVLAQSIINMQTKLKEAEDQQAKINWANEGAARFNEILKSEGESLSALGDKVLKVLIQYLHCNQGALYIIEKENNQDTIARISTYAYGKTKSVEERLTWGTGLIGQSIIERSTIYIKEIPKDYVKITSGLGEATPRNVLIVPLKQKQLVMGVIELASFQLLENYQVDFVEKIAESIATILSNKRISQETERLLKESQQRANELAHQEEEMRQNAEELQATQEQLERQRMEMHFEIENLKRQLRRYKEEVV
ncbi:GAF domain-containing protein [Chryseosolibacter indicus]|uniref:GAF domain-containing protein n=1 Tax=Chryseosolibacter indicus TaxID=2782351 RepID=A0ABS5VNT8_9BACT|nr:GAF domain-containing protein [Chryseosolibacter indicus]MBT1703122.1 GAF domain-containing protein [Chryseosolibacter indicus]